jgi:uncharacterized protein YkwD
MGPAAGSAASQSGKSLPGVILAIGLQDGTVQRRSVALKGLAFETQVEAGSAVGLLDIQLLVDRGRGPEIAAQFPVGVGRRVDEPRAAVAPEPALDQTAADGVAPEDLGRRLAALVLGSRQAAGVALPASSTALDEVASSHVADMRASGFFAHVSPRYGDLPHRLARRGVIVTRSLENIARAHDIDEVLRQWLASPAHRANLLDPDIDAFGVDAEVTNRGEVLAVLVLCRRADEGDNTELAHRALVRINAERLRQGLTALAWDEDLARLAETHSRESAQGYTADDVVARVARELDCDNAAANVFVGTALDPVTHSPEVLAAYERAGIGVVRTNPHDPRLWITVIYAAE